MNDISTSNGSKKNPLSFQNDIFEKKRASLVKYYNGEKSLLEKMAKNPDGRNLETVLATTLEELVIESDDLLSNKLILTEQNNLKEANNVTIQRTNVLGKIADISLKKQELVSKTQDVDLNSPAFFLDKSANFLSKSLSAFSFSIFSSLVPSSRILSLSSISVLEARNASTSALNSMILS